MDCLRINTFSRNKKTNECVAWTVTDPKFEPDTPRIQSTLSWAASAFTFLGVQHISSIFVALAWETGRQVWRCDKLMNHMLLRGNMQITRFGARLCTCQTLWLVWEWITCWQAKSEPSYGFFSTWPLQRLSMLDHSFTAKSGNYRSNSVNGS